MPKIDDAYLALGGPCDDMVANIDILFHGGSQRAENFDFDPTRGPQLNLLSVNFLQCITFLDLAPLFPYLPAASKKRPVSETSGNRRPLDWDFRNLHR